MNAAVSATDRASVSSPGWSAYATGRLTDRASCPVCDRGALVGSVCARCGADLTTAEAHELWNASRAAADALRYREQMRLSVPHVAPRPKQQSPLPPTSPAAPRTTPAAPTRSSSTTVQSVLAVAGAGLCAIAAIVFTFFNPELGDPTVRALCTAIVSVVFLLSARGLAARALRSSAETVGALGVVFVALSVYAVTTLTPAALSPWVTASLGTLIASSALLMLAVRVRIRSWFSPSLVGLALTPGMLALASEASVAHIAGTVTTMAAALALLVLLRRTTAAVPWAVSTERHALTGVQVLGLIVVVAQLPVSADDGTTALFATAAASFASIAMVSRASAHLAAARWWSFVSGAAVALTAGSLGLLFTLGFDGLGEQFAAGSPLAALAFAPAVGLLGVSLLRPPMPLARRRFAEIGAFSVAVSAILPVAFYATLIGAVTLTDAISGADGALFPEAAGAAAGLALATLVLAVHGRTAPTPTVVPSRLAAAWLGALAVLAVTTLPTGMTWLNVAIGVVAAVIITGILVNWPTAVSGATRAPWILAAHLALLLATAMSWKSTTMGVVSAAAVVVALYVLSRTVTDSYRWVYLGVGYAYALVAVAAGLSLTVLGQLAVVSLTTTVAALVAIATTFSRLSVRAWWTVLLVTAVPFFLSVLQVVRERSGWTALSTTLIFALALTLVFTRRSGRRRMIRVICAISLVPSLAVIVICLGAQLLLVSASPVTLPIIAAVVALALMSTGAVSDLARRRGLDGPDALLLGASVEVSALVTGAIAVGLALARDAAGAPTALIVLIVLSLGAAAAAALLSRRHLWWASGVAATGALWVVWTMTGVALLEAYVLPPSLAAAIIGMLLLSRGARGTALVTIGLAVSAGAMLSGFAVWGGTWRLAILLAASAGALVAGRAIRGPGRFTSLPRWLFALAALTAAAGTIQTIRIGLGADALASEIPTSWACLALSATSGVLAAVAAFSLRRLSASVPGHSQAWPRVIAGAASLYAIGGMWTTITGDWSTIWSMWALMLAVLSGMIAAGVPRRRADAVAPPVWFLFALAFVTAVVAWSPRELRVEWFSLPLGIALLIVGVAHLRSARDTGTAEAARIGSWPHGGSGSWWLLTPGLVVTLSASMVATFTDPLTWRAILVMIMALAAILVGARRRLAAPFVIGVVALPIENVSVFAVQIGRRIESMPWWITLAAVGAVLLIIAVSYERRGDTGVVARLGDLR